MAIDAMPAPEVREPVQGADLLEKWLEFRERCLADEVIDHPGHVRITDPYR
jgi:hypothetical protein